jgi:AraC-like DNA-binding protein
MCAQKAAASSCPVLTAGCQPLMLYGCHRPNTITEEELNMIYFAFNVPNVSSDKESESYLDIHNVGIESNDGANPSRNVRPKGRKDYLLVYTHNAKVRVKLSDGTEHIVDSHCVLFKPSQPQDYALYPDPEGKFCWVHFNGTFAADILRKANLYNTITSVQKSEEIYALFKELVITLRRMEPNYKLLCNSLFLKLLFLLSENITEPTEKNISSEEAQKKRDQKRMNPAVIYINENLDKNITLETLAGICALSKTSFTHTFSKTLGVSPIAYVIKRKLEASLYYLLETNAPIKEIADKFGFKSPFYYSNRFKQQYGVSPTEYRKQAQL